MGYLRKAPKVTYQVTHSGNNKQSVQLALAAFHETATAPMRNYISNRLDATNILSLFYKVFVICIVKQRYSSSNELGNAAVHGDHKLEILLMLDLVETW